MALKTIGTSMLARVASRYRIAIPFNGAPRGTTALRSFHASSSCSAGYVDPFAQYTAPPTPPPSTAAEQQRKIDAGGLIELIVNVRRNKIVLLTVVTHVVRSKPLPTRSAAAWRLRCPSRWC